MLFCCCYKSHILQEDYRKVQTEFRGDTNFFTSQHIKQCMKKVIAVNLHETVHVDETLTIRAFYAGHVLGAAMFQISVGSESVMYTGEYRAYFSKFMILRRFQHDTRSTSGCCTRSIRPTTRSAHIRKHLCDNDTRFKACTRT